MRTGLRHLHVLYTGFSKPNLASLTCRSLHTDAIRIRNEDRMYIVSRFNGVVKVASNISLTSYCDLISTPEFGFQYVRTAALIYYTYAIRFKGTIYTVSLNRNTVTISPLRQIGHVSLVAFEHNKVLALSSQEALKQIYDLRLDQLLLSILLCSDLDYLYEKWGDGMATHII